MKFTPTPKTCSEPKCSESFTPHRWAPEQQPKSGWFHQRDGLSWCPLHVPEWVAAWREKKQEKKP